ncbi:Por secretion system C-terminal sorting domain-containing protein [Chishuiella changwenlii]|uniref:Por secretion system C-terminal sorting domain-containing protein n=1 Tax=Chishuiella changwenlii TaxID=1434701 RepID=A0A1M7CMP1_9FLAO|nr:T9SS type A sorting domain-containing protein [Chishuiella changwenlii]GGF09484.1 hypothetical protein GCM10010984_28290 [Chishuiella changwenlii]SHL68442.1 Por secretion system C-terminal sorting domain-containing protein [Chishuiella changwenlii]
MKKNLLALFALGAICSSLNAQNTFINDAVIVKVNPNTLFYNGGSVTVNTPASTGTTEKIINQGNIQVRGGFTNQNTTGKNFVNKYTGSSSYGQLIIDNASTVTGNIAIEKTKMDVNANDYAMLGLPFLAGQQVSTIMNRITGNTSFSGSCAVNTPCGQARYTQSALVWDVANTEYDAVTATTTVSPGSNYTLNVRNGGLRTFIQGLGATTSFGVYGVPNNKTVTFDYESGLRNFPSKAAYSSANWGSWKELTNNYDERYNSYLGNPSGQDGSVRFGKNIHRFSNPFTSNLDLSDISRATSWLKIVVNGVENTPTQLHDTALRIRITKLPIAYTINWGPQTGGSNTISDTRISAYLTKAASGATPYTWAGNPDALLIKPFEYFEVEYPTLVAANIGGTNVVTSKYTFTDTQKTFDYNFSGRPVNSGVFARSSQNQSQNDTIGTSYLNDETLKQKGLVGDNDFTQVELFLSKNNEIQGEAGYLINSSNYTTGSANPATVRISTNPIYIYEETKTGEFLSENQTLLNEFNSQDYVGKPIKIGFNNLEEGAQYRINLRLFEQSILNQIDSNFNVGTYYLLDKVANKVSTVDANTEISFTADDKINDRFEFYWNQEPKTLGTDDLNKNNATYLYANNNQKFVRFEERNTTATVEVYDVSGRLISRFSNVNTNSDYKLDIAKAPNLYVVVVTYKNGKVVSEKTTNK